MRTCHVPLTACRAARLDTNSTFIAYTTLYSADPGVDFLDDYRYYSYLPPMLLPVTFVAVFGNWVAMKFFRHN